MIFLKKRKHHLSVKNHQLKVIIVVTISRYILYYNWLGKTKTVNKISFFSCKKLTSIFHYNKLYIRTLYCNHPKKYTLLILYICKHYLQNLTL